METTENRLQAAQSLNNKGMIIFLFIVGSLLAVASGFIKAENRNSSVTTIKLIEPLASLQARFAAPRSCALEVDKLRKLILNNKEASYKLAIVALTEEEDPELFLRNVSEIAASQESYFNTNNDQPFVCLQNDYLNSLYERKNREVFAAIENEYQLKSMLVAQDEKDLEMENWMTTNNTWKVVSNSNRNIDKYLSNLLAAKNEAVYESIRTTAMIKEAVKPVAEEALALEAWMTKGMSPSTPETGISKNVYLLQLATAKNEAVFASIQLECKCKKFLAMKEKDEPLEVEEWMIDAKCWCPDKKQKEYLYDEPYAMKNN